MQINISPQNKENYQNNEQIYQIALKKQKNN